MSFLGCFPLTQEDRGGGGTASAATHTTCSSSHPTIWEGQRSESFTQSLCTIRSPDNTNSKIYSACGTAGKLTDAESSVKLKIKLDRVGLKTLKSCRCQEKRNQVNICGKKTRESSNVSHTVPATSVSWIQTVETGQSWATHTPDVRLEK